MFPTRWVADSFFSAPFLTQEISQKNRLQPFQALVLVLRHVGVAHAPCDETIKRKTPQQTLIKKLKNL